MKVINLLTETREIKPVTLALGFFDGVHLGHIELISQMVSYGKNTGLKTLIFTFDQSPKKVLNKAFDGYLTTTEEKFEILSKTGVDEVCYVPFTKGFAALSYQDFVKEILIDRLEAESVFVGYNFSFGTNKSGNSQLLEKELNKYGRKTLIIDQVKTEDKETVSSSRIREAIKAGDIIKANQLLGRKFSFSGEVVHGDHRGTQMGFPTANLLLENSDKCLPPKGVYACYADTADGGTYPAIVNIGYRPTFDKSTYLLEAHLCNFEGDLYGQELRIRFLKSIRPEIKFPNMGALILQIDKDRQTLLNLI